LVKRRSIFMSLSLALSAFAPRGPEAPYQILWPSWAGTPEKAYPSFRSTEISAEFADFVFDSPFSD
jgi:hypothetical protein